MKRLIIFLLLFAALKVAGQTIGHLRFDTVMIYKVGGTGELALMNATKDTLGLLTNYGNGRTRFIKSRVINDSTIVVGLDTLTIRGTGTGSGTNNTNITPGYRWLIPSTQEIKGPANSNTILWDSTSTANALTAKADTGILATQFDISSKLNSSDTADKWLPKASRLVDTMYRVNDSTIGFTIKGVAYTIEIKGSPGSAAGSNLTTIVRKPIDVLAGDSAMGIPDTIIAVYDDNTIRIDDDSALTVNPYTLGTLYQKNSWASGADFTLVGSPTLAYTGNKINVSGGNQSISATVGTNNTAYNQVIRITDYGATLLEQWKAYVRWKVDVTPASGTGGFAFGTYSSNSLSSRSHAMGYFNMSTSTGTGKVFFVGGTGNTTALASVRQLTFSEDDTLEMIVERQFNRIMVTVNNLTTDSSGITILYQYDPTNSSAINLPNRSDFAIANIGGAYIIDSISITSDVKKYPNLLVVGDSKTAGYSTPFDVRYPSLLERYFPGTVASAGPTDATGDVVARLTELLSLEPKQAIFCIGRNDVQFGVAEATWKQNIRTIDSTFTANNIPTYWLNGIFENQNTQTTIGTYIDTLIKERTIKTLQAGNQSGAGHVASDNIHPSIKGAQFVAEYIKNSGKIVNYAGYLNDKFNPQWTNTAPTADSQYLTMGTIRDLGGTYTPDTWSPGDHVMREGAAITAAFGTSAQKNRLVINRNSGAQMEFRTYTGGAGILNNKIFQWYTGGSTTGTQTERLAITVGGNIMVGASSSVPFSGSTGGDINMYFGGAIRGMTANTVGNEAAFIPYTVSGHTEFRNYSSVGEFRFFNSTGVAGTQSQFMTITPTSTLKIGTTASASNIDSRGQYWNRSIGVNKDSIPTITSLSSHFILVQDTSAAPELDKFKKILSSNLGFATGNLYTTNGSLSGARTVTLGSNDLTLDATSTGQFKINGVKAGSGSYSIVVKNADSALATVPASTFEPAELTATTTTTGGGGSQVIDIALTENTSGEVELVIVGVGGTTLGSFQDRRFVMYQNETGSAPTIDATSFVMNSGSPVRLNGMDASANVGYSVSSENLRITFTASTTEDVSWKVYYKIRSHSFPL